MWSRPVFLVFAIDVLVAGAAFNSTARAATAASIPQQQPPEQQQAPPSQPGKVKIWTNDDLIALRTPADIYILEKEAQAAAIEMQDVMACFAWDQTESTIDETQKAIQDTLASIRDSEDAVAQIRKQLDDAPENLKARNQKELERRATELETSREQLKVLQQRLRELSKQPAGESPPAPTTASPE